MNANCASIRAEHFEHWLGMTWSPSGGATHSRPGKRSLKPVRAVHIRTFPALPGDPYSEGENERLHDHLIEVRNSAFTHRLIVLYSNDPMRSLAYYSSLIYRVKIWASCQGSCLLVF